VKSRTAAQLIDDLEQTFTNLHANHIKLNSEKCMFGVLAGKLLGFIVFERGIEVKNLKGAQRLTECLAALSHFISRLRE